MSYFKISIIDNDPKGGSGGTCYFVDAMFDCTRTSFTYTSMDVYRNTEAYQNYRELWASYQVFLVKREKELLEMSKGKKEASIQQRIKDNTLSDDDKKFINAVLYTNAIMVTEYEKVKDEKRLNALVGRCLGQAKMSGIKPMDPLAIKHYIIETLK